MENLLCICVPTYNRADIVYECVKNLLSFDFEWISVSVTDNCSTDGTYEKLKTIDDSRFFYHRNEKNIGYANLMQCMKNGNGKFCLLLSDEDDLYDVDWNALEALLKTSENVSVYQCRYLDENGKELLSGPPRKYACDTYKGYFFAKTHFMYAGGTILKKDVLDRVWDGLDKNSYLWSLYCEIIVPFACSKYASIDKIDCLSTIRTNRNNKGKLDTYAWNGSGKEPYWSLISRSKQYMEWFDLLSSMETDDVCKNKLLLSNRYEGVFIVYHYCSMIHDEKFVNSALAKKNMNIVERDLQLGFFEWIRRLRAEKKKMDACCKKAVSKIHGKKLDTILMNVRFSIKYMEFIIKIFIKSLQWNGRASMQRN